MLASDFRARQVHLDFHTSEHIPGLGSKFDGEAFAKTLVDARVNSITCFARCHHGWIYYDTKKHATRKHPTMKNDLLRGQIDACHIYNIKVPIYVTVQWDNFTANEHPEWLCTKPEGGWYGTPLYRAGFYRPLCVNSPYKEFLKEHVEEILDQFPNLDGLFFDGLNVYDCSCKYCRESMTAKKINIADPTERWKFYSQVIYEFKKEMTTVIRNRNKNISIFYNNGHVGPLQRQNIVEGHFTHLELESLPSGDYGYYHFLIVARYARTLGIKNIIGQTGRFHTYWGDFHSYKSLPALEYECFRSLALNAGCAVGDQLHPHGQLDKATYDLIGSVYKSVEEKEPWCVEAMPLVDIALFNVEEVQHRRKQSDDAPLVPQSLLGAARMLQELQYQFDVVDSTADFNKYKVVILPDRLSFSNDMQDLANSIHQKLNAFIQSGGAVIASYKSGVVGDSPNSNSFDKDKFLWEEIYGAKIDPALESYSPDYIIGEGNNFPSVEHVMYSGAVPITRLSDQIEVIASTVKPFFNRTWEHFCGHQHAPTSGVKGNAAVLYNKNMKSFYFAHPIFEMYNSKAPLWCKKLLHEALRKLLPDPALKVDGPSTLMTTINFQENYSRLVVHVLHYIPERRGEQFDTIEHVIPLHDVTINIRLDKRIPKHVVLVPQREQLQFQLVDHDYIRIVVPKIVGHQMVEIAV